MENTVLRLEKRIKADPERLFRAWVTPKNFARWFLAGSTVKLGNVTLDARPGGRFRIDMIVEGVLRPHEGEYRVVDEPHRLVFTWRSFMTRDTDTLVTVTFTPEGDSTLITLIHERIIGEMEFAAHRDGWTSILEGLTTWIKA